VRRRALHVLLMAIPWVVAVPTRGSACSTPPSDSRQSVTRIAATAEALVPGAKCGLSASTMLEVLRQTGANNAHLHTTYPNKALKGDFSPMFMLNLAYKAPTCAPK
jgi:hypothetical protein